MAALCEKQDPFPPMANVTAVYTMFACAGLPQIPTQSQNSDNEVTQPMFHTENASLLSEGAHRGLCEKSAVFHHR